MTGTLAQRVRQWLRRCDTLFLRLFVLLWLALAGSHLVAFHLVGSSLAPPAGVPEPQTVALVMAGLLACAAVRRRVT